MSNKYIYDENGNYKGVIKDSKDEVYSLGPGDPFYNLITLNFCALFKEMVDDISEIIDIWSKLINKGKRKI